MPWWSRWSGSTLVITATSGVKARNEPSLSSASATKMSPAPWCAPAPDRGQVTADGERRVEPAVLQRDGEHRRGGGLAVRARHGRRPGGRPSARPAPGPGAPPAGPARGRRRARGWSRGSRWRRRRVARRAVRWAASCPTSTRAPSARRASTRTGVLGVRPGHRHPAGEQDAGDAAHPGTADADQVDPLRRSRRHATAAVPSRPALHDVQHEPGEALVRVRRGRTPAPPCPPPPAAPRRPAAAPAPPAPARAVSSASGTSTPPPAATTGSALSACSPLPCGSGTYTAGRPTARHLGDGHRPRPAQHEVGGGVGQVHPPPCRAGGT